MDTKIQGAVVINITHSYRDYNPTCTNCIVWTASLYARIDALVVDVNKTQVL